MDPIAPFMAQSGLVFFQPNERFWAFITQLPWRHKQFHDMGAGMGCLTQQMRQKGFDVKAYDLYPKEAPCVPDIQIVDVTKDFITAEILDCFIFARPCHSGFVDAALTRYLEMGDALYISMPCNVPEDIGNFHHEIVAYDVGAQHENVYRIWGHHKTAKMFHYLTGGSAGWWQYDADRNRYINESGYGGFTRSSAATVAKEQRAEHCDMFYVDAETGCDLTSKAGWLSPEGTFYGCATSAHSFTARKVLGTTEKRLETAGWVKMRGYYAGRLMYSVGYHGFGIDQERKLTLHQQAVLKAKGYKVDIWDLPESDANFTLASELVVPPNSLRGRRDKGE